MSSRWYCKVDGKQYGPLSGKQLKRMVERGQVTADSPIRRGDDGRWIKASQVKGLLGDAPSGSAETKPAKPPRRRQAAGESPPPPPGEIPTGRPVSAPGAASTPAQPAIKIETDADPDQADSSASLVARRSAKSKKTTLWLGLGAVGLAVAAAAVVVVVPRLRNAAQSAQEVAAGSPAPADPETAVDPEVDPASAGAADAAQQVSAEEESSRRAVDMVKRWRDARRQIRFGDAKLSLNSVWLSSDPSGDKETGVAASGAPRDASTASESRASQTSFTGAGEQSRYMFVELRLENTSGDKALAYTGWNGVTQAEHGAAAVDEAGKVYLRISLAEAPARGRIETARLAPGEAITDVLVFAAPAADVEKVKLALPYGAIHPQQGSFGFEIGRYMMADGVEQAVKSDTADLAQAEKSGEAKAADRANVAAPVAAKPSDKPPSITDLIDRSFEKEQERRKQSMEADPKKQADENENEKSEEMKEKPSADENPFAVEPEAPTPPAEPKTDADAPAQPE